MHEVCGAISRLAVTSVYRANPMSRNPGASLHEFHKVSALEVPKCFESESITSVASCSPYLCNSEDESNNEGKCKGNISN